MGCLMLNFETNSFLRGKIDVRLVKEPICGYYSYIVRQT